MMNYKFFLRKEQQKMKGFTLLELIMVIIIIGILATLGFAQYGAMIEKSRGGEARETISTLRSHLTAKNYEGLGAVTISGGNLGIVAGMIPPTCTVTNYFSYSVDAACATTACTFTATRCTTSGKTPNVPSAAAGVLRLIFTNTGTDTWSSTAGY